MKKVSLLSILLVLLAQTAGASDPRYLMTKNYQRDDLRKNLVPFEEYHPFPDASERSAWDNILPSLKEEYIARGEEAFKHEWSQLTASNYMSFKQTGERVSYSRPYHQRRDKLFDMVLAECLEREGRFLEQIVDGIWFICEETSWCIPSALFNQRSGSGLPSAAMREADPGLPDVQNPVVDLFAGETVNLMAWTYYLLGDQLDQVSPLIKKRMDFEIKRRIIDPLHERNDYWWLWIPGKEHPDHHINNWTPWVGANWLTALLLVEDDEEKRIDGIYKCMEALDRFLNVYHEDGGCDEGPGYFNAAGGAAFDCLELLYAATGGAIDLYHEPLIQNMGSYIYKAHIAGDYYTNFADAHAKTNIHSFHLYRFAQRTDNEVLAGLAASKAIDRDILNKGIGDNIGRQLYFLFNAEKIKEQQANVPLLQDVWLPGIQVMAAREKGGSTEGLYVAAKGGFNDESHNHNDAGHFIVYSDGQPAIVDVGVGTYTAQTFSTSRYDIWTMQSAYHNLPTVNAYMQAHGKEYKASNVEYSFNSEYAQLNMDMGDAYPKEAGVEKWNRNVKLDRKKQVVEVTDSYALSMVEGDLQFTLMTPCDVVYENNQLHLTGGLNPDHPVDLKIQFDQKLIPKVETINITDSRLKSAWGDQLYRILLVKSNPGKKGEYKISISQTP